MKKTKELLVDGLQIIAIGVLVAAGFRLAEWVIPEPEVKVIVCMADDVDRVEACESLSDLVKTRGVTH